MFIAAISVGLALGGLIAVAQDAGEGNPYEIKSIQKVTKTVAAVDNGWKENAPCIQAELRVKADLGSERPYAKAYFFDKNHVRVLSYGGPAQVSDDHQTYTAMPAVFKPRQVSKVCFPIGEKATQTGSKWTRVLIVFGDGKQAVAETYPKDDVSLYDFPEKQRVLAAVAK